MFYREMNVSIVLESEYLSVNPSLKFLICEMDLYFELFHRWVHGLIEIIHSMHLE